MQVIESQCYSVDGKNRGVEAERDHHGNERKAHEQTPIKLGGKSSRLKRQVGDRKDAQGAYQMKEKGDDALPALQVAR